MLSFLTLTLAVFATLSAAAPPKPEVCDPAKLPDGWVAGRITAPLIQVTGYQKTNPTIAFRCSGTVVVLDGCSFMVKDFIFGNALQTKWYAGIISLDPVTKQVIRSDDAVNFSAQDVAPVNNQNSSIYSLIRDPIVGYSFNSVNQLRVFDIANQQIVCTADLPNANPLATQSLLVSIASPTAPFGVSATAGLTTTTKVATGTGKASAAGKSVIVDEALGRGFVAVMGVLAAVGVVGVAL
ncbi:hypothetical protein HDU67_001966 [Dinochytrium kinnereticum]|nr:hypothetical protein HDU67_001966 [Dinochytrium kinnereticum]